MYFLPYLYKRILRAGGRIERKQVNSFDELESFDLIINCAGLGAHTLVNTLTFFQIIENGKNLQVM